MKINTKICFIIASIISTIFALECPEEGSCNSMSELNLKRFLLSIPDSLTGKQITPMNYCDNIQLFQGDVYIEKIIDKKNKRKVFIFKKDLCETKCIRPIAYVWIDSEGTPIEIPKLNNDKCDKCQPESAYTAMGNSYVGEKVEANGCVVMLVGVEDEWLNRIREQSQKN